MNNKHILDLTLRLSQALDQNYDVVSMDTVLSVIAALEGTTITKEQLEATRLAKYINQLRRRTKCENLARRAKSLLKKWREMVGIQQSNESSAAGSLASGVVSATGATVSNSISTATAPFNMPVADNAVSTSHLTNPQQISHQHTQRQNQYHSNAKQCQIQQQPYHSQPSSPVNLQEKSNTNEYLISMSNPATGSQMPKSTNTNVRKKKRLEKTQNYETISQQQQQPTSFANLLTGLGSTFGSTRKTSRDKPESVASTVKPVETFIIEHSSNSNSDLICLPSNNTVSNFTSATDVHPVVIDLQDTNSSMNSLVSKDVTNASLSFYRTKSSSKKSKKEKKRKERNLVSRQNQPLQDCDDQNTTTTASYHHKRASDDLLLDDKSHSVCPTMSNISEILSLSNSSMSSVFPSADAISKNVFQSGQSELASSSSAKMSKSDLTFAGKFKQNISSSSGGCNVLNYNSDSMNVNILSSNSSNQNKFSLFGGGVGATTNSNDSSSNSRTAGFNVVGDAIKPEASNSKHDIEDVLVKHDNEKSISNMSIKGNSSTDNLFDNVDTSMITATQQQSIDLTTMDYSSQQTVKQPKKRGRKKGSKGVDAVIAKDTSLSSQMLMSSLSVAGKKVKTTKELYAEMENRKLRNVKLGETAGNSSTNWITQQRQQHQQKPVNSRRASFCSDIVESDSCTMTSEPSRDSGNILNKNLSKREQPLNNNSNCSDLKMSIVKCSSALTDQNSTVAITTKIKQEIQEIFKQLTPPPSVKQIEYNCFNNITPCTCTIEEVVVADTNNCKDSSGESSLPDANFNATNNVVNNNEKECNSHSNIKQMVSVVTEDVKGSDKNLKDIAPQQPVAKIKKSIFDLDFDDDEDPLNSIIADIVGKSSKVDTTEITTTSPVVIEEKPDIPLSNDDELSKVDHINAPYPLNVPNTSAADLIVFPSYEVNYDPDCAAKNRFEVQTQKITKFHIDTLHNYYIPNVNGNWNHADFISNSSSIKVLGRNNNDMRPNEELIIDGYGVVPLYGTDMNEQIIKDLSHIKFTHKLNKHSNCKNEIFFQIPFLGASRVPEAKLCSKDMLKLKLEEEKDNKLNLNSNFNKSTLDSVEYTKINATLANENDACDAKEMERVQNVDSSNIRNLKIKKILNKINLKPTKRNATQLGKRSSIKRLKLTVNGNLETTSDVDKDNTTPDDTNYYCVDLKDQESACESDSDSDSDCSEDQNYNSEAEHNLLNSRVLDVQEFHHEVVKNNDISDLSVGAGQNHHIVLTIKKSSSKTNSPLNSLSIPSSVATNLHEQSQANKENSLQEKPTLKCDLNEEIKECSNIKCDKLDKVEQKNNETSSLRHKSLRKKRIKRRKIVPSGQRGVDMKLHNTLFYHEELCPVVWNGSHYHNECIFHISSCSSGCSADEETTYENFSKNDNTAPSSIASDSSDNKYDDHVLNKPKMQTEFESAIIVNESKNCINYENNSSNCTNMNSNNDADNDVNELPEENNSMLLSFNNICKKYTREENAEPFKQQQNHENNLLKQQQQLQNCDDYNNLSNNFNLIKYIDNKTSSVNNINHNNNNTNSCSNNYSDTNIISSSSSCSHENPTNTASLQQNLNRNDRNNDVKNNVQIKPLIEYQTGIRAVDEDVNDNDGNNCGRLQQFKEWFEVLQLHSYNDEVLTVLPYVVLE